MTKQVEQAIQEFVEKKEPNRQGVIIPAVAEQDKGFMRQFLPQFYEAYKMFFKDETIAEENFCKKLESLTAIRFDSLDEAVEPLSGAYADMRKMNNGKLNGGLCYVGDGFNFVLDADMMTLTKDEATHTLIHEMIHVMTSVFMLNKSNKTIKRIGITADDPQDKVAIFFNEGFTEKLAQIMWSRMYPNVKCPGIGRYDLNVIAMNLILAQLGNEDEIIEKYFIDAIEVIESMKNQVDINNKNLWEYIHEFKGEDFGNVAIQKQAIDGIKTFVYSNTIGLQI